ALRITVGRVGQLPILARVRAELLRALGRSDTTRDLARVAAGDTGLVAKLLQLANAGFFGLTRRYSVVEDAAAARGGDARRRLVASLPVRDDPFAEEQQRRASAVAALASVTVRDVALEAQAYTAGLLRGLGRQLLDPIAAEDEATRVAAGAYLL